MAGGRIEIDVVPNTDDFPDEMESGLEGAVDTAQGIGEALGIALGTGTIAAGLTASINIGREFDSVLNQIKGSSRATAEEMELVSAKSKELGQDIELPGTSATDSAAAMLALSKGGFSVQESMDAARGSLALAAAAQVDAASAAEIQSDAINTFNLEATDAARVADVLANAANSSSAEITDIAQGLAQGGTVAASFRMSIEDTSAALALFANNGIKGSDAGTLLKSTLLALTDKSNPAVAAQEALGLSAYNAAGEFVGLDSILQQLSVASENLTDEQYQAAASTLFGTDAARLAAVAASDGATGYREMRDAINEQGSAVRLAAAFNEGVPGMFEAIGNAAEAAGLQVYDLIRGPLNDMGRFAAEGISQASTRITEGITSIGEAIASNDPRFAAVNAGLDKLASIGGKVVDGVRPIGEALKDVGEDAISAGGALPTAGAAFSGMSSVVSGAASALGPVGSLVGGAVSAFSALPGPIQTGILALAALRVAQSRVNVTTPRLVQGMQQFRGEMRTQASLSSMAGRNLTMMGQAQAAYRTSTLSSVSAMRGFTDQTRAIRQGAAATGQPISALGAGVRTLNERSTATGGNFARIAQSFSAASTNAGRLGPALGTVAATGTAARVAAGGLLSAVGGLAGGAILGATVALSYYAKKQQEAAKRAAEHKAAVDGLAGSIDVQTGKLNAQGQALLAERFSKPDVDSADPDKDTSTADRIAANKELTFSIEEFTRAAQGEVEPLRNVNAQLDAQVEKSLTSSVTWNHHSDNIERAGVSAELYSQALRGNKDAQEQVEQKMLDVGVAIAKNGWQDLVDELDKTGTNAIQTGKDLGYANDQLSEAQKQAQQQADALAKADPRARSLAEAMRVLGDNTASAADKSNALKTALDALSAGSEGLDAAVGTANQSIERLPGMWQAAADAVGGYGAVIDRNTGRINQNNEATRALSQELYTTGGAMRDVAQQAYESAITQGQSQQEARDAAVAASQGIYDAFMRSAEGARLAGVDVDALARQLGILPPAEIITLLTEGGDIALAEILTIKNLLDGTPNNKPITIESLSDAAKEKLEGIKGLVVTDIPNGKGVTITAETEAARKAINDLLKTETKTILIDNKPVEVPRGGAYDAPLGARNWRGGPIRGYKAGGDVSTGTVGPVYGPGSGTSDSITTAVPLGSHVITAAEITAAGGQSGFERLIGKVGSAARATSSRLVPVRLSNGERVMDPAEVEAFGGHGAVSRLRGRLRGGLPGFSLGGLVNIQTLAAANDGLPYITGARDCSMWVSAVVQAAKSEPVQRLFTTYSLIDGQTGGLVPGADPSDYLTVGTSQEHMAATVMTENGPVNTESGGSSNPSQVRWGRGAAGAFDAQFPYRFHLPVELINPQPSNDPAAPADPAAPSADGTSAETTTPQTSSTTSTPSTIAPPTAPKLEDVAAEAAKIGVRGLLETFDLQDSVLGDPNKSMIGRAAQIAINTERYRNEQGKAPERTEETTTAQTPPAAGSQRLPDTAPTDPYEAVNHAPFQAGAGTAQWSKEITAALQIANFSGSNSGRMTEQGDIESEGDNRAIGPDSGDGAPEGTWQVKPGTFATYRDPMLPDDPFNVLANGVAALGWVRNRWGSPEQIWPSADGYAEGGLRPMAGGRGAIVPPGQLRVIGDRQVNDEFYIPDTDDPNHIALGAEWAKRRGFQLVSMFADGGIAQKAGLALHGEPVSAGGEQHFHEGDIHLGSGDQDGQLASARRHRRIARQGRSRQIGNKGTLTR